MENGKKIIDKEKKLKYFCSKIQSFGHTLDFWTNNVNKSLRETKKPGVQRKMFHESLQLRETYVGAGKEYIFTTV